MPLTILAYAIGGIGMLVEWQSYRLQCGKSFRRWSAAGALFWATQYLLLGATTAALTMGSTALRTYFSGWLEQNPYRHLAAGIFVLLFVILTAATWQGLVSLLPAFAVINTTLALFYLDNRNMRIACLASSLAWIANDVCWQAWPAFIAESVAVLLNMRTIRRMGVSAA